MPKSLDRLGSCFKFKNKKSFNTFQLNHRSAKGDPQIHQTITGC